MKVKGVYMIVLLLPLALIGALALIYLVPVCNRLFSLIWEDPTERQRKQVARRLKELHINGDIPEETAVLLAAKEFNVVEQNLLDVADIVSPADVKAFLTGKKSAIGIIASSLSDGLRRGADGKGGKMK